MTNKKRKISELNISNKLSYTLIAIVVLILIGVGVFALTPGVKPNPGHLISDIAPPSGCASGQVLSWNGSAWNCVEVVTYPVEVKQTSAKHNGNFGGYNAIESWIQNNGCNGYHVCSPWELVWAHSHLPDESFCNGDYCYGWYSAGLQTSDVYTGVDCQNWHNSLNTYSGHVWTYDVPNLKSCDWNLTVLCCK